VRVAPNTLSFNTASALKTIYGHSRQAQALQKSQFYEAFLSVEGAHNTHNSINKTDHGFKRRVLSAGFSETALKSMENYVIDNINTMINNLKAKGDEGVDMGSTFSYLTLDIMGELCFGRPFGLLKETTLRYITELVGATAHLHYIVSHMPSTGALQYD
jgi:cytochrome P450